MLWAWRRGFLGLQLLDVCAVPLALGYAVGRVGCQLSGDGDYGVESDLPWAMAYPDGTVATTDEVHPTPIYESLAMGSGRAGALAAARAARAGRDLRPLSGRRRGRSGCSSSSSAATTTLALGLTLPQVVSVAMIAVGAAWLAQLRGRLVQTRQAG